ncbi:hypothetical protein LX99_02523 [Mucilaginibacter oryzae]|uniref:Lipoprotein n=1 Tax=Mucilaginibacter oryzae TaxID=468058 RepID=A0A316HAX9_9SPHI|nr:hypothetical protein [Mucilaginibacter oryzae]PWK77646.1 hypothetical protein LX99_02523 [Mucilaginibacter oryzae]
MTISCVSRYGNLLIGILPVLAALTSCQKNKQAFQSNCNAGTNYKKVSFAELVNHAEKYQHQYVEVSGKYREGFEQSALFNGELFADHSNASALWVDFSQDCPLYIPGTQTGLFTYNSGEFVQINNRPVIIRGIVDVKDKGHLNQYRATIDRVSYIEL